MTRASEFCYIAEGVDGRMLMAIKLTEKGHPALWTNKPEEALRHTRDGIISLQRNLGAHIGFRKVLAG